MPGLSQGETKLVVVISLDDQVELVLLFPVQGLGDGQLTGVWMDLEKAH